MEKAERLKKPNNYNDNNHYIEEGFDSALHRDESIDKP
jgi:hypothetical protein